jgi:predicted O-linked N-acetylglucosamine transferase (SPINDLY family)
MASSLLNAIGIPELIANSQEQYEAKAIELATNPEKIKAIKDKLKLHKLNAALFLFDTPRFTKNIEAAYVKVYDTYQLELPVDHIYI